LKKIAWTCAASRLTTDKCHSRSNGREEDSWWSKGRKMYPIGGRKTRSPAVAEK